MLWFALLLPKFFTLLVCRVFYVRKSRILIPGRLLPQKQSEGNNPDSKMAEEKEKKEAEKVSASVVDHNHADECDFDMDLELIYN